MERKTTADFDPELLILFDAYVHGHVDRRGFLDRASRFAVGGVTAGMLLDALSPNFAFGQQVPKDDKRIKTQYLEYPSPQGSGKMRGYFAAPANATGKLPGVLSFTKIAGSTRTSRTSPAGLRSITSSRL